LRRFVRPENIPHMYSVTSPRPKNRQCIRLISAMLIIRRVDGETITISKGPIREQKIRNFTRKEQFINHTIETINSMFMH